MSALLRMMLLATPKAEVLSILKEVETYTVKDTLNLVDRFCKNEILNSVDIKRIDSQLTSSMQELFRDRISLTNSIAIEVDISSVNLILKDYATGDYLGGPIKIEYMYTIDYFINGIRFLSSGLRESSQFKFGLEKIKHLMLTSPQKHILSTLTEYLLSKKNIANFPNIAELFGELRTISPGAADKVLANVFRYYVESKIKHNDAADEDMKTVLGYWQETTGSKAIKVLYEGIEFVLYGRSGPSYVAESVAFRYVGGRLTTCSYPEQEHTRQMYKLALGLQK